jgi:hypothetical protein
MGLHLILDDSLLVMADLPLASHDYATVNSSLHFGKILSRIGKKKVPILPLLHYQEFAIP